MEKGSYLKLNMSIATVSHTLADIHSEITKFDTIKGDDLEIHLRSIENCVGDIRKKLKEKSK